MVGLRCVAVSVVPTEQALAVRTVDDHVPAALVTDEVLGGQVPSASLARRHGTPPGDVRLRSAKRLVSERFREEVGRETLPEQPVTRQFQYRFSPPTVYTLTRSVKGAEWYQTDEVAQEYEEKRFSRGGRLIDRREKRAVLDTLEPLEDRKVLEIACGTGRFTVMLAERGADIVGLDISAAMLQQGRQKARNAGVSDHLEFMRGDAGRLPFPDDHFDTVFAMRFFHLADTPATFLSEMRRVASEQVFFDTFNARSSRSLYNSMLPMGSRLYSRSEVEKLLDDADLRLVNAEHDWILPYGFYRKIPGAVAGTIRNVDTALGDSRLGDYFASVSYWNASVE